MYIDEVGIVHYSVREVDYLTAKRKVRPAMGAFGDWSQYDAEGNPTVVVDGVTRMVSEQDDLANDWGYATQTEQRLYERGDEPEHDPAANVWYNKRGEKVDLGTERNYQRERSYDPLAGYHKEHDGVISCWYCGGSFSAAWFIRNEGLSRKVQEAFAIAAALHTNECRTEHNGFPLIRLRDKDGKPYLRRAQYQWVKDVAIQNWLASL